MMHYSPGSSARSAKNKAALVVLVLALRSTAAWAQNADRAAAQTLFNEARALMEAASFSEACSKFADSQRLAPATGTLLNLALCEEKDGKTASAWLAYSDALAMATHEGNAERRRIAQERITALEPTLRRLLVVPPANVPRELWIKLDDIALSPAAQRTAFPVDAGVHHLSYGASGKLSAALEVEAPEMGKTRFVQLQPLRDEPSRAGTGPQRPRPASPLQRVDRADSLQFLAGVSFGIGTGAIIVGAYCGLRAKSEWSERQAHCVHGCDNTAVTAGRNAQVLARASNIAFIAGATTFGVGTYLFLSWLSASRARQLPVVAVLAPGHTWIGWQTQY
jgi:hypothetical protein